MIFNLNEQKVLSDPSGSSVFKGEKDFNDIVVNLPDNIDGHTATELNYVMHFVDSDGGYSTKILTVDSSGEALKATATVSTNITPKAQAFYAYVLMTDDEETVIGKTNGVIVMIHPVPDEENEIIPPADADEIIKGLEEIVQEATETIETATDTIEEATEAISSKQDKLTAGENITISDDNVISAEGGIDDYNDLSNKPSINGIELLGNKTDSDLGIQKALTAGENVNISQQGEISVDLSRKVDKTQTIVGCSLSGNISRIDFIAGLFSQQVIVESTNYPPSGAYEGLYIYPCIWISSDQKTVWLMTDIQSSGGRYQTFSWQRLNTKTYVSTEPAPNSTGSNVQPLYDIGDMWVQKTNNDTLKNIYICIAKQYVDISSTTWKYTYTWVDISQAFSSVVSGVVNANGTITFTDSNGNTFTTTGTSVIGADGFSPVATVTQTASGATISITDSTGTTTANISNGQDGNDYILTAQDKSDIADIVLSELPTTQGVLYGNQSN